eukprot:m.23422 g.23422  ORF g.23422 m.23422 type:complete len:179 (-) comp8500_c0_seq1:32-568(-)
MARRFSVVVAATMANGIGFKGGLPWPRLKEDLAFFRKLTETAAPGKQNAVIMGRATWESIPKKFQPLSNRVNVVITSKEHITFPAGVLVAKGFEEALALANRNEAIDHVFVIGGARVYQEALSSPQCGLVYMTRVHKDFPCDTFIPPLPSRFIDTQIAQRVVDNGIECSFHTLRATDA